MATKCPKCQSDNTDTAKFCSECATPLQPSKEIGVTKTIETPIEEYPRGSTFADRYKIIEKLGTGGMGAVYRVEDTNIGQDIALKLIKSDIASDKKTIERFRNELKTTRMISHRNVCRMFDLAETEGTFYITMEYVSGEDLKSFIRRSGKLDIPKAISIAKEVCEGLAEAHRLGVVHRDLKSSNIMIDKDGNARIMDFGIARSLRAKGLTGEGIIIGTPEYMSPEQAEAKEVDHRSDVYSLGVILYEMVTGELPFEGDTPLSIAMKHKGEIPKDPKELNTQIPDDLNRVIMRCLEKDKEKRYQSTGEVRSELENIEKGIPSTERFVPKRKPITAKEITVTFGLKKLLIPALFVVALVIIALIVWQPWSQKEVVPQLLSKPFIAVLPFVDLSPQKDQEYFCDGMTDEIISKLSIVREWKVIPRTSMLQYKDTTKDIKQIGQELEVETILEGSVRKEKDNIRVITTLINVADSSQLWSKTYDQKLESVFDIQSDIAEKIASALKTELSSKETEQLTKKPTENLEAYDFYLRGREYYYIRTKKDNEKAIVLFNKALELDSNYALAYSGLGDAYSQRTLRYGFSREWLDVAIENSNKAISLDPNLSEAYKALGLAFETKRWLQKAREAYERAINLNPNYLPAVTNLSYVYYLIGELDKALVLAKKALQLRGPNLGLTFNRLGIVYLYFNERAKAEESFRKSIEVEPGITFATRGAHFRLSQIYLLQENFQKARNQIQNILTDDPNNPIGLLCAADIELLAKNYRKAEEFYKKASEVDSLGSEDIVSLGYVLWKTGDLEKARKMLDHEMQVIINALESGNEGYQLRLNLARMNAIKGNKVEAYEWMERAINAGLRWYAWVQKDPRLENLHNDKRFQELMDRVKAMVSDMKEKVKNEF